jgi:putative hydrolase of the HAD superfamily
VAQSAGGKITSVLFDLYETLITESVTRPTRASSLAAALGLDRDAYRKEWKARRPQIVRGQLSFADALTDISQVLTGRADVTAIQQICRQRVREKAIVYDQIDMNVTALVTTLVERGIKLAVVSNGFAEDVLGWSSCSLASAFEYTAFSCIEHVAKPDPDIYQRALKRMHVDPAATLYIGDGGDDELTGAERVGLQVGRAPWFVSHPHRTGAWPELRHPVEALKQVEALT